ncbi:primary-amine oxidase [Stigmatella aurantiaca]|uniref:Amine oxidase n=1 Tax=Stigmatella aurantiaca TaxID=41 RepID=A0A1H7VWK2_STIAU|nr:primary-amine oxidase [Stigmatella aurantiaca]SEM13259.1 primary-amine oxidase [Stigmatella aurantiaca]
MGDTSRCTWLLVALTLGGFSCAGRERRSSEPAAQALQPDHPLSAFSQAEFKQALQLLRAQGHVTETTVFPLVVPREPSKEELESFQAGSPVPRRVLVVAYEPAQNQTFEAVVRLTPPGTVESWTLIPGVQPPLSKHAFDQAKELVWRDERWTAALHRRGVDRPDHIYLDIWAMGPSEDPQRNSHRLVKALPFFKGDTHYTYARPVEGLIALVDLTEQKVVELIDQGNVPIPRDVGAYDEQSVGPLRPRPHPVVLTHPEGRNFSLAGNEVRWQNWRFRVDVHPREGPVLHLVTYADQGRERKILHRLSLSEMVVPYGDPQGTWSWRSAFDVGEYGFGDKISPLDPGADVPSNATFLPAAFADDSGKAQETPRAVALYERDGGVLWKHYDAHLKRNEARLGIELVVTFGVVVENYDYLLNYIFKQDGSLEVEAVLTGIMLAKAVPPHVGTAGHAEHDLYGHRVAEGVVAVHHQHFFSFRLDFDVDGRRNSVLEMNSAPIPPGPANPQGNAFSMRMEPLRTEMQAQRDMSLANARRWLIINPQERNGLGHPTGYALLPGENSLPFAAPDNLSRRRAGFINHAFWATRYAPGELSAAGAYPNQSQGGDGLPTWVKDDQPLVNEDVVVWYTLGVTHTPRPEEWPVMPTAHAGFKLLPVGFFTRNPALDLPEGPPR